MAGPNAQMSAPKQSTMLYICIYIYTRKLPDKYLSVPGPFALLSTVMARRFHWRIMYIIIVARTFRRTRINTVYFYVTVEEYVHKYNMRTERTATPVVNCIRKLLMTSVPTDGQKDTVRGYKNRRLTKVLSDVEGRTHLGSTQPFFVYRFRYIPPRRSFLP